ncbi:MAG: diaminopimelate decarboxylase [Chitinophagales bacterium]|nr:diaminopimelate decarboxylase [Chitinophagales bacterium]
MILQNNDYYLGDVKLTDITNEFDTPVYVYDANTMTRQFDRLKNAFPDVDVKIKYACKALTNISVMKHFKNMGAELDAVSIEEVLLGLHAGFLPDQILFTPNCVSIDEIKKAVDLGVTINIDNISILEQFGHIYGNSYPCCIRINPHIEAGGHQHIQTGHIDSKFGISIYQIRHVLRVAEANSIKIIGLHMHTGSDILDSTVFLQGAELLFDVAANFPDLEFIDFGSGFKVPYKDDDVTTDIEELGRNLSERFNSFCKTYGRKLGLWFEPGKFLVSEAGLLLVQVNVLKPTMATVFAGVNSGQNHLIRPMFYDAYHSIVNISNPGGTQRIYTVVGYVCETDTLARDRKLNEIHEGDILAIKNAGAYGYTMSNNYNSRLRPPEVFIVNGKPHLIRQRETLDDLLKNQIVHEEELFSNKIMGPAV